MINFISTTMDFFFLSIQRRVRFLLLALDSSSLYLWGNSVFYSSQNPVLMLTVACRTVSPSMTGSQPSLLAPELWTTVIVLFLLPGRNVTFWGRTHRWFYPWMRYVFMLKFVLNLTFLLNYLLPIRRQLPCATLVIFKTQLPFLLESKAVRQSSQLCEWLQWLRWLSSMYMTEAEQVVLESNNPNPSLFHLRYSASKCSIKLASGFKLAYAFHL